MPGLKNTLPRSFEAEETAFSFILRPVYPRGAKNTRGSGLVRNQLNALAAEAAGIPSDKNVGDYTKEEKASLMRRVMFFPDNSVQVVKGGDEEALARKIAEAGENYAALFGAAEETPEDYANAAPSKLASSAVARVVKGLRNREASDADTARFIRETIIPGLVEELQRIAQQSDNAILGIRGSSSDQANELLNSLEA